MLMRRRLLTVLCLFAVGAYYLPASYKSIKKSFGKVAPNRYDASSPLETVTPTYVPHCYATERPSARSATTCNSNCSWEVFTSNDRFKQAVNYRAPFSIDDTDILRNLNDSLTCSPQLFGYSVEVGNLVFPPQSYPSCQSLIKDPQPTVKIDHAAGTFTMNCPNGDAGSYMLNPKGLLRNGQYYYHELDWQVKVYPGRAVPLEGSEFVYASCGSAHFTQAQYIPQRNSTALSHAKELMQQHGLKHKPLAVVFMSIDSFSRRHFFRKLEKTVEQLNTLNRENSGYSVFDFKLHNVLGATSTENMVPMFGNHTFQEFDNPPYRDLLGASSLWSTFRKSGFVTLMGYENCDYHFPAALGKVVEVDHFARNFYCAASKYLNVIMSKEGKTQRCIGGHMSHYYMLNYTYTFAQEYKEVNQFTYIHLNAAHEETGQHAATLDDDLDWFLSSYLTEMRESHDVVVVLQGDHGMRYGNWYKDIEAYQENKLPALFMIASNRLLDRLPAVYDTLWHNTMRLVSKRDLRATLLGLAWLPYGKQFPVHQETYLSRDFNLLSEKVKDMRNCEELDIPPWYCSCLDLKEVDADVYTVDSNPTLNQLLTTVAMEAIAMINAEVFSPSTLLRGLCQKLTFRSVLKAYGLKLGQKMEQMQLEFGVNESKEARFEVYAILGTENGSHFMRLEREREPLIPITYRGHQARMRVLLTQIIGVQRKDKYKGPCEVVSRENGLRGELCVCNDLTQVRERLPALFE